MRSKNKPIKLKSGVLIEKNGRLLLINELNKHNGKYYWNIVKGTFDANKDKSLTDTALRECREEINAKVKLRHILNVLTLKRKNRITLQLNFIAVLKNNTFKPSYKKTKDEYIKDARFFSKAELKKLKKSEIMDQRTAIAINEWLKGKRYKLSFLTTIAG